MFSYRLAKMVFETTCLTDLEPPLSKLGSVRLPHMVDVGAGLYCETTTNSQIVILFLEKGRGPFHWHQSAPLQYFRTCWND